MYRVNEDAGVIQLMIILCNVSSTNISAQVNYTDGSATGESCSNLITIDTIVV